MTLNPSTHSDFRSISLQHLFTKWSAEQAIAESSRHLLSTSSGFTKRPIEEVAEELGVELTECGGGDSVYYTALCPLHDDKNPSFVIYPESGRFICFSCCSEGGDVIDLVQRMLGVGFVEAKKIATTPCSIDEDFAKFIARTMEEPVVDMVPYALRYNVLANRIGYDKALEVWQQADKAILEGKHFIADSILKSVGV